MLHRPAARRLRQRRRCYAAEALRGLLLTGGCSEAARFESMSRGHCIALHQLHAAQLLTNMVSQGLVPHTEARDALHDGNAHSIMSTARRRCETLT